MIEIYYSSVSGNNTVKSNQNRIFSILDGQKIKYSLIDIATDENAKEKMKINGKMAPIPQFVINGKMKGGFIKFQESIEQESLNSFLEL